MAKTTDIKTNQEDVACDICGRTLLRGEHAEGYLAAGQRRQVCELCTARAQHEGWIRESGGDDLALRHPRGEGRGRSFIDRLRTRRERAREVNDAIAAEEVAPAPAAPSRRRDRERDREEAPEPVADAPRRPRHVRAVPTNADLKMERALEVFNASDHTRTVGGVARSLGAPVVCVRPLARAPERRRDHRDVGALAGTATRSTSPTRRAACGAMRRATSSPSSPPRSRSPTPPPTIAAACIS